MEAKKQIIVHMSGELWGKLRNHAYRQRMSVAQCAREALADYIGIDRPLAPFQGRPTEINETPKGMKASADDE